MKKLLFLAVCYCLQSPGKAASLSVDNQRLSSKLPTSLGAPFLKPGGYDKALRHFNRTYINIANAAWTVFPDHGFVCTFHQQGVVNRVHYDQRGNWMYTIAGYDGKALVQEIRKTILEEYPGYRVCFVDEIISPAAGSVYMINIENESNIKVIRATDDHTDLLEDLEKY